MCPQAETSECKENPLGLPAADLQQLIPQTGINTASLIGLFSDFSALTHFNSLTLFKEGWRSRYAGTDVSK